MPHSERPASSSTGDTHRRTSLLCGEAHRRKLIEDVAYARAQRRGFAPGHEVEDWLAAEALVDANLLIGLPRE